MDIEKKIIECAADAYGIEEDKITADTDIRNDLSKQSLMMIAFISSIEDELDVRVDMREAADLKTIRDFANKVKEMMA